MGRHGAPFVAQPRAAWPGWRWVLDVLRGRVAAYPAELWHSLRSAPVPTIFYRIIVPLVASAELGHMLVAGPSWQRWLAGTLLVLGVAPLALDIWFVQRPARPGSRG